MSVPGLALSYLDRLRVPMMKERLVRVQQWLFCDVEIKIAEAVLLFELRYNVHGGSNVPF